MRLQSVYEQFEHGKKIYRESVPVMYFWNYDGRVQAIHMKSGTVIDVADFIDALLGSEDLEADDWKVAEDDECEDKTSLKLCNPLVQVLALQDTSVTDLTETVNDFCREHQHEYEVLGVQYMLIPRADSRQLNKYRAFITYRELIKGGEQ